jgi:hypothetical protein
MMVAMAQPPTVVPALSRDRCVRINAGHWRGGVRSRLEAGMTGKVGASPTIDMDLPTPTVVPALSRDRCVRINAGHRRGGVRSRLKAGMTGEVGRGCAIMA